MAKICDGLSHEFRYRILERLKENNGKMLLSDLERSFVATPHYRQWSIVKSHVDKMALNDLVEITKDENDQFLVILKKDVEIYAEDVG